MFRWVALVLAAAFVSLAPANDKPEQISAAQPSWDHDAQVFEISFAVKRSMIPPDPMCTSCATRDIGVNVTVEVQLDNAILVVSAADGPWPLEPRPGVSAPEHGFVVVQPIRVPWDRDGGRVAGEALVTVELELARSDGITIPGSTKQTSALLILIGPADQP